MATRSAACSIDTEKTPRPHRSSNPGYLIEERHPGNPAILLFVLVIAVGSFAKPFRLQTVLSQNDSVSHLFMWDGLLAALILLVGLLALELLIPRLRRSTLWTTLSFLTAVLASLGMEFGFITRDL